MASLLVPAGAFLAAPLYNHAEAPWERLPHKLVPAEELIRAIKAFPRSKVIAAG